MCYPSSKVYRTSVIYGKKTIMQQAKKAQQRNLKRYNLWSMSLQKPPEGNIFMEQLFNVFQTKFCNDI